jgi:hypothetical protein
VCFLQTRIAFLAAEQRPSSRLSTVALIVYHRRMDGWMGQFAFALLFFSCFFLLIVAGAMSVPCFFTPSNVGVT